MNLRFLSLACALGVLAGLTACQDASVVAPDDDVVSPAALVTTAKKPPKPPGGDDPGQNATLVLTGVVNSVGTDQPANILVDNKKKFVGETSHDPRDHALDPSIPVSGCTFDLPDDFKDPDLLDEGLRMQKLQDTYLSLPRVATVVVLWNDGRDATVKFWGEIDPGGLVGVDPPVWPQIHLLAGSSATRDWDPDGTFSKVTLDPVETVRVVFGSRMNGGSVTCTGDQWVTATFYHQ